MNNSIIEQKKEVVAEISNHIANSQATIIFEYRGLTVKDLEGLRKNLRKEGAELKVYKNTMFERALEAKGLKFENDLAGPNAFIFSSKDAVSAPKVLTKFAKDKKDLVIKHGIVDQKVVSSKEIKVLASLPNREGLISMLLGCLQAPVRNLAYAVKSVGEKK